MQFNLVYSYSTTKLGTENGIIIIADGIMTSIVDPQLLSFSLHPNIPFIVRLDRLNRPPGCIIMHSFIFLQLADHCFCTIYTHLGTLFFLLSSINTHYPPAKYQHQVNASLTHGNLFQSDGSTLKNDCKTVLQWLIVIFRLHLLNMYADGFKSTSSGQ